MHFNLNIKLQTIESIIIFIQYPSNSIYLRLFSSKLALMAQYLFNVQNMKMIFILAAGLYSWNFIRKQRQNNQQSKKKTKNQRLLEQKLRKIGLDQCSTDQIYEIFKGIDQNKKLSQEQISTKGSGENKRICNGQNSQNLRQQQDIQAQLNKILSEKLMRRIEKTKPLEEIKNEWVRKWGVPVPTENQQEQDLRTDLNNHQHIMRIKPSQLNKIKMQDAICNIEFSKQDDSFQFFPPVRRNPSMDIQNHQDSIIERVMLRTNQQCLKLADRIVPKQKLIMKQKYKTTPKKKLKNKDRFDNRLNNTATPQSKQSISENERTQRKNQITNTDIFSRNAPPIQLLLNKKDSQCSCNCGKKTQRQIIQQDANKMQDQTLQNITIPNFPTQRIQRIVKTSISYEF